MIQERTYVAFAWCARAESTSGALECGPLAARHFAQGAARASARHVLWQAHRLLVRQELLQASHIHSDMQARAAALLALVLQDLLLSVAHQARQRPGR